MKTFSFSVISSPLLTALSAVSVLLLSGLLACGGSGGSRSSSQALGGSGSANTGCSGECASQAIRLDEVSLILRQGIDAATQLGVRANIAVLDRVGNVLAVYQMEGATPTSTIRGQIRAQGGLEEVPVPSALAAISKAGTGAYLSSQGQAFSTRTASQIIQEHFDPGEIRAPGGPLFGVQFSQLLCSDISVLDAAASSGVKVGGKFAAGGSLGPRPLPLGLSADPGGFPLYKQGDLVGGVGVEIDGEYTLDRNIRDFDSANIEELVALASSRGFEAPAERVANNIIAGGKTLRYSDVSLSDVPNPSEILPDLELGSLRSIPLYFSGGLRDGVAFGTAASGVVSSSRAGLPSMTLVGPGGADRFPVRSGIPMPGGAELHDNEVQALLDSTLTVASRLRAAIRVPLDSRARVSIFIVDSSGNPLGFTRSQDAPVFGIDVALQKARTALFFSSPDAGEVLSAIQGADSSNIRDDYAALLTSFLGSDSFPAGLAFTSRAVGNLSRPFYPDGIDSASAGPLSLPFPPLLSLSGRSWSPFSNGLQLDLVFQRLVRPIDGSTLTTIGLPNSCTDERFGNRIRNGIQIFAGSVPLYRNGNLIGAIGVSGDGIDQDDAVAFYGASRRGLDDIGQTAIGDKVLGFNAPVEIRSDIVRPQAGPGTRLRYVNCPEAAFLGSNDQNVCDGL